MNKLDQILNKVSMYRLMLYYLLFLVTAAIVLAFFGILPYKPLDIILSGAYLVLVCYLSNKLFAYLFQTKPNLESRSITALILTLIIGPVALFQNVWFLSALGVFSMASKYILVWDKRHILNPAAFAVFATAIFLGQGASWWVGSEVLAAFVILGGLLVIRKIKRFHVVAGFLLPYLGLSAISGASIKNMLLLSPILFFSLVMLVEPLTAPKSRNLRIAYGVLIALLLAGFQKFFQSISYSLELSLLLGNLAFRITNPDIRGILTLKRREALDTNIFGFWFEPQKSFGFAPGQFLEWTLPHSRPDNRGVRRYFTIASSPTEPEILLATRYSEPSSSFKRELMTLKPGAEIVVSNREGEFTLPQEAGVPLVFIAGGIGITPFRAIIKYLIDNKLYRDIILLYSNRRAEDMAFEEIFHSAEAFGIKTVYVNTDKDGYINQKMIQKEAPDWQERLFYVSGPEPMVEAFEKMLYQMGLPKKRVKRDYFPGYTDTHQGQ